MIVTRVMEGTCKMPNVYLPISQVTKWLRIGYEIWNVGNIYFHLLYNDIKKSNCMEKTTRI